jgi:pimeloyl-ACP methyl ester carboxylesterase
MEMLGKPRVTTVEGIHIAWSEFGTIPEADSRPPVVLIHGLGDSHRTWRRAAPSLARHFRVIMPDLPGHGLSSRPDAPYTLEWYARMMRAFLDALELPRVHLVGHSFGGGIAQWMLLDDVDRIDRLVLVAPGGLGRDVSMGLRLASFPVVAPLVAPHLMGIGTRVMLRGGLVTPVESDEIARSVWLNGAPGSARAFCRTVSGCIDLFGQTVQAWDRLHEVRELPPLKLVWGARDPIVPVRHGLAASLRFEGATFARYEKSGHFPHLDESARFGDEVVRFLDPASSRPRARVRPLPVHARRAGRGGTWKRFWISLRRAMRARLRALAA